MSNKHLEVVDSADGMNPVFLIEEDQFTLDEAERLADELTHAIDVIRGRAE